MTDGKVNIVVELTAKEGSESQLLDAMRAMVPNTTAEEGCERFELLQAADDPRVLTLIERFASQEAFDFHATTPYVKDFLENKVPQLVEENHTVFYSRLA